MKQDLPEPDQLKKHKCEPCEGGVEPLTREEFEVYLPQVPGWSVVEDKKIEKEWVLKNFVEAMDLVQKIGEIAEEEGHHPDILIHEYKKVRVSLWTHAIGGLSVNDFVVAVKIEELVKSRS